MAENNQSFNLHPRTLTAISKSIMQRDPGFGVVLLEKTMYNRVYSFLSEGKLLYTKQFGFRKNTSTAHTILQLVDDITKAFSNGEYTLGVFIDLSKAFDTINHEILLKEWIHMG